MYYRSSKLFHFCYYLCCLDMYDTSIWRLVHNSSKISPNLAALFFAFCFSVPSCANFCPDTFVTELPSMTIVPLFPIDEQFFSYISLFASLTFFNHYAISSLLAPCHR
ncbi:hypothetical protein DFH05DRAFT_293627 [Lentinula detonsa]|uniref:Uncharacterized protein n=1 Tax=Lentinula detonsa TaxID=2804962 RepID=A0A9W8NWE9_9AGAR|nr:hypothetical protein DFH05DRAFT_293627 [Lentinula detonsa]